MSIGAKALLRPAKLALYATTAAAVLTAGALLAAPGPAATFEEGFAVVNSNGDLARGFHAVRSVRRGVGAYLVTFDSDVTDCAYNGTLGRSGSIGNGPPAGMIGVMGFPDRPGGILVETRNVNGDLADRPFHLIVLCPFEP